MKKVLTALCVAAAASWVVAAAAATGTPTKPIQNSQKSEKAVTLTGCLEAGQTANTYMLKDVSDMPGNWSAKGMNGEMKATGSTAMKGATGKAKEAKTVELLATPGVDLKAHLGHEVEVTGMPAAMMGSAKKGAMSMSENSSSGMPGSMEHRVRVESVKHLSDTCTGSGY
jgi:hypothetical protein